MLQAEALLRLESDVPVRALSGLSVIADAFDLAFVDIWGVLHDGIRAHAAAGEALTHLRARGTAVVLVSNAPRPSTDVIAQLDRFGVPRSAYDGVVTSGDVVHAMIAQRPDMRFHHIGPERDRPIFAGLTHHETGIEQAETVLCSGLFDDEAETPEDYREVLAGAAQRGQTMICANPDLVVERGQRLIYCAGALAQLFESMGGHCLYAGKPYPAVYEAARVLGSSVVGKPVPRARQIAIGDAFRTDIAGAKSQGIASLLCAAGIHGRDVITGQSIDLAAINRHGEQAQAVPDYALMHLRW
jgi:HAD superfamily hydrolase (TIGR01459 family)